MAITCGVRHGPSWMAITDHTLPDRAWALACVGSAVVRRVLPTHAPQPLEERGLFRGISSEPSRPPTRLYWPPGARPAHTHATCQTQRSIPSANASKLSLKQTVTASTLEYVSTKW